MNRLTDQARAYAEIDNNPHDKSFFVAYEAFKAGAEWYSKEIQYNRMSQELAGTTAKIGINKQSGDIIGRVKIDLPTNGIIKGNINPLSKEKRFIDDLVEKQIEALKIKFRCFLYRVAIANLSGVPIANIEAEFEKLFNTDESKKE